MTWPVRLAVLAAGLAATLPMAGWTQDASALAARCSQLYAVADRALSRRGEGGGGANMIVQGANIDCQKGRYEQGIRDLEKALRAQGYTVPRPV
jgi:hypothetical protein